MIPSKTPPPDTRLPGVHHLQSRLLVAACEWGIALACLLLAERLDNAQLALPLWIVLLIPTIFIIVGGLFGLYRMLFGYFSLATLMTIARSVGLSGGLLIALVPLSTLSLTTLILHLLLLLVSLTGFRLALPRLLAKRFQPANAPRTLIYGAGEAGRQIAAALEGGREMRLIGFLDDNPTIQNRSLHNLPVFNPGQLGTLISEQNVMRVLLAIPSLSRARQHEILNRLMTWPIEVKTLPSVNQIAEGRVTTVDLRPIVIDDLLGRDQIAPIPELLARNITDKTVLISGAGGSIGSELARQVHRLHPKALLLLDQSENSLFSIDEELRHFDHAHPVIPLLASVTDTDRLRAIFNVWQPETVFHAAAHKHVPMVEHNLAEGVRNNVFGTLRLAEAAEDAGVNHFVLISTDKAVRPTSVMGASKRIAEMILQAFHHRSKGRTRFSMVRFGNVLGSSGSVIPKFRQQLQHGGPLTLTHPEMTRYFMTIPEAAQLVIQASALADGGDVFVLDMGEAIRIRDIAERMITLSGLTLRDDHNPDGDIAITITGLRPGEKLYEELLTEDAPEPTEHPRIMRAVEDCLEWPRLAPRLDQLDALLCRQDAHAIRLLVAGLVTDFTPNDTIVDWIDSARPPDQ